MKKIKVAQIITRLDWGGPPDIIRLMCTSMDRDAFDVWLITGPSSHASAETRRFLSRFQHRTITVPQLQRDVHPLKDFIALLTLYRLLKKKHYDIVHTHTAKAGALGRIAAWLAGGTKVIHTPHGHNFYGYCGPAISRVLVTVERLLTRVTTKITSLTELEKCDLGSYDVSGPEKVAVINSGLELDRYREVCVDSVQKRKELHLRQDSVLVGMIGRLEPVKGPEYFVSAAHHVLERFPGAEFLIVGEGSLRQKLESRCAELNITDSVRFTGWREDIPEIMKIVDILVLPSLNEAVGRVLLEAGACGKAVVASRVGGVPEIVKDGETGILVPPCDADSLSVALLSLLENEEKRLKLGEFAKRWADDKFSASGMIKRFTDLYEEVTYDCNPFTV